jgi:hypothetical protein
VERHGERSSNSRYLSLKKIRARGHLNLALKKETADTCPPDDRARLAPILLFSLVTDRSELPRWRSCSPPPRPTRRSRTASSSCRRTSSRRRSPRHRPLRPPGRGPPRRPRGRQGSRLLPGNNVTAPAAYCSSLVEKEPQINHVHDARLHAGGQPRRAGAGVA